MNRRSVGWIGLVAIALAVSLWLGHGWHRQGIAHSEHPIAQAPASDVPVLEAPGPSISGTYEDPQGDFQIGVLEGYSESAIAGSPLFQSTDGSIAYSIVKVPLTADTPLSDIGLVDVAQTVLRNGEGFQTRTFAPVDGGGLQIAWSGRLSQGAAPSQPISGTVLAKQQDSEVYVIVVAALEAGAPQVAQIVSTLASTLQIL